MAHYEKTCNVYQDIEHAAQNARNPSFIAPVVAISTLAKERLPLGQILETARLQKGLTIHQLSQRVKMPASTLTRFEAPKQDPDVCAMHILKAELGVSL